MCLAQFVGPLSGGHINCAVSFALFIGGRVSFVRCALYTFSQMAGSIVGAIFLLMIFGRNWPAARAFGSNSWDEDVFTGGQVFFAEMLGTMLLGEIGIVSERRTPTTLPVTNTMVSIYGNHNTICFHATSPNMHIIKRHISSL